jgi:hypothetical protein
VAQIKAVTDKIGPAHVTVSSEYFEVFFLNEEHVDAFVKMGPEVKLSPQSTTTGIATFGRAVVPAPRLRLECTAVPVDFDREKALEALLPFDPRVRVEYRRASTKLNLWVTTDAIAAKLTGTKLMVGDLELSFWPYFEPFRAGRKPKAVVRNATEFALAALEPVFKAFPGYLGMDRRDTRVLVAFDTQEQADALVAASSSLVCGDIPLTVTGLSDRRAKQPLAALTVTGVSGRNSRAKQPSTADATATGGSRPARARRPRAPRGGAKKSTEETTAPAAAAAPVAPAAEVFGVEIRNLPATVTSRDMLPVFTQFDPTAKMRIRRGVATVTFSSAEIRDEVLTQNMVINDQTLEVTLPRPSRAAASEPSETPKTTSTRTTREPRTPKEASTAPKGCGVMIRGVSEADRDDIMKALAPFGTPSSVEFTFKSCRLVMPTPAEAQKLLSSPPVFRGEALLVKAW